jgi:PAS domain S-box-containing protein
MESTLRPDKSSAAFWQLAMEGSNDGYWDWNVETNEVVYSHRWKEILGYAEEELPDELETFNAMIHPEDRARVYAEMQHHFTQPSDLYTTEFRMRCKDGTYKWVFSRGLALRDAEGKVLRMAGSHTDITARKENEEALRLAHRELDTLQHAMVRICAWTKKVNLDGQWVSVEEFLATKLGVQITHGMSEEAMQQMNEEVKKLSEV